MTMKSPITTHVLDTMRGEPAAGIKVVLELQNDSSKWDKLAEGKTDNDGRIGDLLLGARLVAGIYRLTFQTGAYFEAKGIKAFYPYVTVAFEVTGSNSNYHVPLLLSPFGYSTYRGS
ncbi:MAG: hydroxyisourate hydrolase [Ignavibacteriae bacterium]|nr:hydroxyisourate hydrolase [Ignavibacteriota bacterium]